MARTWAISMWQNRTKTRKQRKTNGKYCAILIHHHRRPICIYRPMDSFAIRQVRAADIHSQKRYCRAFSSISADNEYAHFIVKRVNHNLTESLFEINALMAICDLEIQMLNVNGYGELCQLDIDTKKCCRPWSLPNYIALLSNKTSCFDIDVSAINGTDNECLYY